MDFMGILVEHCFRHHQRGETVFQFLMDSMEKPWHLIFMDFLHWAPSEIQMLFPFQKLDKCKNFNIYLIFNFAVNFDLELN